MYIPTWMSQATYKWDIYWGEITSPLIRTTSDPITSVKEGRDPSMKFIAALGWVSQPLLLCSPGPSSIISEVLEAARDVGLALEKQTQMDAWRFATPRWWHLQICFGYFHPEKLGKMKPFWLIRFKCKEFRPPGIICTFIMLLGGLLWAAPPQPLPTPSLHLHYWTPRRQCWKPKVTKSKLPCWCCWNPPCFSVQRYLGTSVSSDFCRQGE